jgi:hypothetical protein
MRREWKDGRGEGWKNLPEHPYFQTSDLPVIHPSNKEIH